MSIKESLIKNYKKAGGSDPAVMESTSRLIENTGSGGGGEMLVVNTVYDETSESYLCDASWNDVKNAFDSAAQVFLKVVSTTDPGGEYESTQTTYNLLEHLETATSVEGTNYRCTFFGNYYADTTDPDQNMYVNY